MKFKKCRTERQTHPVTHYYIDINALKIVAQFLSKKYLNSHLAILIKNTINDWFIVCIYLCETEYLVFFAQYYSKIDQKMIQSRFLYVKKWSMIFLSVQRRTLYNAAFKKDICTKSKKAKNALTLSTQKSLQVDRGIYFIACA